MKALREARIEVPWLGTLCADWPLVPLRYLVTFLSGGTPDKGNADFWTGGTIPWVSPKDMKVDRIDDSEDHITAAALGSSATQRVPVGSVLVVVRGMILAHTLPVAVTTGPVTINQDIKALVCGSRILPEFLHAVFAGQAEWLLSQADSSAHGTRKLETEVLQRFEVPCPPLDLQRKIVTAIQLQAPDLDGVVAAKRPVLELLAEKRKAIIATAITGGLDPNVKLRDSSVQWLGEIPAHWETKRLKYLGQAIIGLTYAPADAVTDGSGTLVLRASNVQEQRIVLDDNVFVATAIPSELVTRLDDILICSRSGSRALIGKCALIGPESEGMSFGAFMMVFRGEYNSYLFHVFNSPLFEYQAGAFGTSTINQLTVETLSNMEVPLPPDDERQAIVDHIIRETEKLDAVRVATERTIALLKERRSALIAAAVTGQLDMEAAA